MTNDDRSVEPLEPPELVGAVGGSGPGTEWATTGHATGGASTDMNTGPTNDPGRADGAELSTGLKTTMVMTFPRTGAKSMLAAIEDDVLVVGDGYYLEELPNASPAEADQPFIARLDQTGGLSDLASWSGDEATAFGVQPEGSAAVFVRVEEGVSIGSFTVNAESTVMATFDDSLEPTVGRSVPVINSEFIWDLTHTSEGDIIGVGCEFSSPLTESIRVLSAKDSGSLNWEQTFASSGMDADARAVATLSDGSIAVVGMFLGEMTVGDHSVAVAASAPDFAHDMFFLRLSGDSGEPLAVASAGADNDWDTIEDVITAPDGGVLTSSGSTTRHRQCTGRCWRDSIKMGEPPGWRSDRAKLRPNRSRGFLTGATSPAVR